MTRSFVLFGDGFLQEGKTTYCYSIGKEKLTFLNKDELKLLNDRQTNQEHHVSNIDFTDGDLKLTYEKKEKVLIPLTTYKNRKKSKLKSISERKAFSLLLVTAIEEEYRKGFFVLTLPENILVDEQALPYFIYKGTASMPLTGFAFKDCFIHTKRLIQYIFVNKQFSELLQSEQLETNDSFLIDISESDSFESLKLLLGYQLEENIISKDNSTEEPIIPNKLETINSIDCVKEIEEVDVIKMINQSKKERQTKEVRKKPKEPEDSPVKSPSKTLVNSTNKINKNKKIEFKVQKTLSLYTILLGLGLFVSLGVSTFLLIDKISYPSRLNELRTEVKDLTEGFETKSEKYDLISKELEEMKQSAKELVEKNKNLSKEIESNVSHLKNALDQNEKLKTELGKK